MKRLWSVLVLVILLGGLVSLAAAQGPVGQTPELQVCAAEAPGSTPPVAGPAGVDPEAVLYFWDFEGSTGGFASTLDWVWGTYAWDGGACDAANYPPPSAYSGMYMWGTRLNNCYHNLGNNSGYNTCVNGNPADDSILSFTIDLTGVTTPVEMSWWEWFDLFLEYDWAEVYANGDVVFQHCGGSYIQPTAWVQQTVDLTPYAGGPVTIEFHMMASTVVNRAGWFIDDVMIFAQEPPFEAWKEAPPMAAPGDVISYTVSISTVLGPSMFMTDVLPLGVAYAGNLNASLGYAWYEPADNAVYWTSNSPPRSAGTLQAVDITFDVTVTADCGDHIINHGIAGTPAVTVPFTATTYVHAPPDIEVAPPALAAALCPDTTAERDLLICNNGLCPLTWHIAEQSRTVILATTPARSVATRPVDLSLGAVPAAAATKPWQIDAAVSLTLDDGGAENYIGLNSGTNGYQFLWLNRFTPAPADFPFQLNTISVVFGTDNVPLDEAVDLVVYQDTDGDGDPGNATVVAVYHEAILANDGTTWSDYTLPTPLMLSGPGDVLIAAISRYVESGVEPPTWPAALDTTTTQERSWVASWSGDPPNPPVLPPDGMWGRIDAFGFPGNWLIRGSGETYYDVPWLSESPITGTVAPGECQTVTVTFDATGMAPGDYFANLLIFSNDPDTPQVVVPVTMTVLGPVGTVEVTYTIAGPQVTFDATVAGGPPITYTWNFGDGGTSNLEDPVHTYAKSGCYTVSLGVSNGCDVATWTGQVCPEGPGYTYVYLPIVYKAAP